MRKEVRLVSTLILTISLTTLSVPWVAMAESTTDYLPRSAPVSISIPSLHVSSSFIPVGLDKEGHLQVPATGKVSAWYTGAPTPGEIGPAIVIAHVDMNGQPGVFFNLKKLKEGSLINIKRADGKNVSFKVLMVKTYAKNRFPTLAVYGNINYAGLRLITCGGKFDSNIGHYLSNVVVFASMVV